MAIIRHIRQSWAEIGNERLYSSLYIVGVALSVSTVMVLSIMLYARLSPVYPELKRGRMMYVTDISVRYDRGFNWWGLSKWDLEKIGRAHV